MRMKTVIQFKLKEWEAALYLFRQMTRMNLQKVMLSQKIKRVQKNGLRVKGMIDTNCVESI